MSVKLEPYVEAASPLATTSSPLPAFSSPPETAEDDGAIVIVDPDAALEAAVDAPYAVDTLLGTASVLTGGEEAPPLLTPDYAEAFFNTDPRIAFDALHIGALRTIEMCEKMSRSNYDYPPWYVPEAEYVAPTSSSRSYFTVPAMHPVVQARSPIDREEQRVDELLMKPTRANLIAAIGPDMLEKLRLHNPREARRRARRRVSETPKKQASSAASAKEDALSSIL